MRLLVVASRRLAGGGPDARLSSTPGVSRSTRATLASWRTQKRRPMRHRSDVECRLERQRAWTRRYATVGVGTHGGAISAGLVRSPPTRPSNEYRCRPTPSQGRSSPMASRRRLGGGARRIAGARTYGVLRWATGEDAPVGALVGLGDGLEVEALADPFPAAGGIDLA